MTNDATPSSTESESVAIQHLVEVMDNLLTDILDVLPKYPTIPEQPAGFKAVPGLLYTDMHSPTLGGEIKVGYDFENSEYAEDHAPDMAQLADIWAGPLDLTIHLDASSIRLIEYELRRHLTAKEAWERIV